MDRREGPMRSLTVVWVDSDDAGDVPVQVTQLKSNWQPGEDTTQLLYQACLESPQFGPEWVASLSEMQEGRVLAIFEGWSAPLYVAA